MANDKTMNINNIDALIAQLCPDGVEFQYLWKVTAWDKKFNGLEKYVQKRIIIYPYVLANKFKELELERGDVRLLSTGNYIGWTTEKLAGNNLCEGEIVAIPWGGKANVKYFKGKFVTADNRIATSLDTKVLSNKFLYYWMHYKTELIESFYRGSGIKHPSMKSVLTMQIPIPPLPIQLEIVTILDKFTQLQAELQAELQARRAQYEYYRNELLNFEGKEVKWKTLGEISEVGDGLHGTPNYNDSGRYYFINGNNLSNGKISFGSNTKKVDDETYKKYGILFSVENTVFMSINGTIGSVSIFNNENIVLGKSVAYFNVKSNCLYSRYLFYLLQTDFAKEYYERQKTGATIKNLGLKSLREFKIPIPPLAEQNRIVGILDKFDSLVNDISEGLPAEIEARRKQYEYYRGKLLTFKPNTQTTTTTT